MNRSISSSNGSGRTRRFFRAVMTAAIVGSLMMFACGGDDDDDDGGNSGNNGGNNGGGGTTANTFTLNNAPAVGANVTLFPTTKTITATGFTYSIYDPVDGGVIQSGKNTVAGLSWSLADKNGTYNVLIDKRDENFYKFQNNVKFTDGSATLDWNTMEVATSVEIDYSGI